MEIEVWPTYWRSRQEVGHPLLTTTFTTLTTLTLAKSEPTVIAAQPRAGVSHSTIVGATVGSILGFILLTTLIYCCVRTPLDPQPLPEPSPERFPKPFPEPLPEPPPTVRLEIRDDALRLSRPRRKKRAPMNYPVPQPQGGLFMFS